MYVCELRARRNGWATATLGAAHARLTQLPTNTRPRDCRCSVVTHCRQAPHSAVRTVSKYLRRASGLLKWDGMPVSLALTADECQPRPGCRNFGTAWASS